MHLRLHWQHILKLQLKARGPNSNVELIPVHSPLLRKSCLVSCPPLTYMLKFSGFANLASCLSNRCVADKGLQNSATIAPKVYMVGHPCKATGLEASRMPGAHPEVQKLAAQAKEALAHCAGMQSVDTEAGMHSGISREHNMRSRPCRFTEFCNSRCLSHFAAPFIADRTETSIAESCKKVQHELLSQKHSKGQGCQVSVAGPNTAKQCLHPLP